MEYLTVPVMQYPEEIDFSCVTNTWGIVEENVAANNTHGAAYVHAQL